MWGRQSRPATREGAGSLLPTGSFASSPGHAPASAPRPASGAVADTAPRTRCTAGPSPEATPHSFGVAPWRSPCSEEPCRTGPAPRGSDGRTLWKRPSIHEARFNSVPTRRSEPVLEADVGGAAVIAGSEVPAELLLDVEGRTDSPQGQSSPNEARADVFDYIERFHNLRRRHSKPGDINPMEFEAGAMLDPLSTKRAAVHRCGVGL